MRRALTIDRLDDTFHKDGFLLHIVSSVSMAVSANSRVARKFTGALEQWPIHSSKTVRRQVKVSAIGANLPCTTC